MLVNAVSIKIKRFQEYRMFQNVSKEHLCAVLVTEIPFTISKNYF